MRRLTLGDGAYINKAIEEDQKNIGSFEATSRVKVSLRSVRAQVLVVVVVVVGVFLLWGSSLSPHHLPQAD